MSAGMSGGHPTVKRGRTEALCTSSRVNLRLLSCPVLVRTSMPPNDIAAILSAEKIRDFDRDIRGFKLSEIQEHFAAASSGRVIISRLIKNLVWQAVSRRRAGQLGSIDGNLRSFFYQWVKPVVARVPDALEAKTDPYDTMLEVFVELVGTHRLFRYSELDLTDENFQHRRLGATHPLVVVFAEKIGFFRFLLRIHRKWGVTVMALGGTPSLLSSQYLAEALGDLEGRGLELVSLCDWDPAGHDIIGAQARHFELEGIEVRSNRSLIRPEHFTEEEKQLFRFPLPRRQKSRNRRWFEETGGLDGVMVGLESDAMDRGRLEALADKVLGELVVRQS